MRSDDWPDDYSGLHWQPLLSPSTHAKQFRGLEFKSPEMRMRALHRFLCECVLRAATVFDWVREDKLYVN